MLYQGKCICCVRHVKNVYLNKKIYALWESLYNNFKTPFSNCFNTIRKETSWFALLPGGQMGQAMDRNRLLDYLRSWNSLRSWNYVIIIRKKKSLSNIDLSTQLQLEKQPLTGVSCTKNCFSKSVSEFLKEYSVISVTLQVKLNPIQDRGKVSPTIFPLKLLQA